MYVILKHDIQIYIYDDPGLTLTYFIARSNFVTCIWKRKTFTKSFNWRKCNKLLNRQIIHMFKKLTQGDCLPMPWGNIHLRVNGHHFQTSKLKLLSQKKAIFFKELLWE